MEKKCTKCGILKPTNNFYYREDRASFVSVCKDCISVSYTTRRISDPQSVEIKRKYNNDYYNKNAEKVNRKRKERRLTDLETKIKYIFRNAKQRAFKFKEEFNLTPEYLVDLYHQQKGICALSGEPLQLSGDRYLSNMLSLDRIDSSIGYIKTNVQWVCVKYNMMKAHANQIDFLEMCKKVVEKLSCPA